MSRPSPLVSFSQNAEDVVLARAFRPWERTGTWVDIGAGHPTYDSVTKLFSNYGWTGVNVEPLADQFQLIEQERPNDHNIRCAISSNEGEIDLFVAPPENHGASTLVNQFARTSDGESWPSERVACKRLSVVLEDLGVQAADFLKIDVEGSELAVLESLDFTRFKAKCVVVESTIPNSQEPSFSVWEPLLIQAGYVFALFDGLNRFYFHQSEPEVGAAINHPACVFDNYVRFIDEEVKDNLREIVANATEHISNLDAARNNAESYAKSLESAFVTAQTYAESLEIKVSELLKQIEALS